MAITIDNGNTRKRKSAIDLFWDNKGMKIPIAIAKNNMKNVNRDLLTGKSRMTYMLSDILMNCGVEAQDIEVVTGLNVLVFVGYLPIFCIDV